MDNGRVDTFFASHFGLVFIGFLAFVGIRYFFIVREHEKALESTQSSKAMEDETSPRAAARRFSHQVSITDGNAQFSARRRRPRSESMVAENPPQDTPRQRANVTQVARNDATDDGSYIGMPQITRHTTLWGIPLHPTMDNTRHTPLPAPPETTVASNSSPISILQSRQRRSLSP
jgi:hypothetical protein